LVTPQNWTFLGSYKALRKDLLKTEKWNAVIRLGENGFNSPQAAGAFTALFIITHAKPNKESGFVGLDASDLRLPKDKDEFLLQAALAKERLTRVEQASLLAQEDSRITFDLPAHETLLSKYASSHWGVSPADLPRYGRCFWEVEISKEWHPWQSSVDQAIPYGGRHYVLWWNDALMKAVKAGSAYIRGENTWGKKGIAVSVMRHLPCTLFTGEKTDLNVAIILPKEPAYIPAIWAFCSSPEFNKAVRRIDQALKVTTATLVKVAFDLDYWQKVAEDNGPLPEPHSDDPTQWLFKGNVVGAVTSQPVSASLHVAVARLLGYCWPEQEPDETLDALADADGIVCLPPVAGEQPGAERLRAFLAAAYGAEWSPAVLERLLAEEGARDLETWLRDGFFASHCRLFHNRPFLWHVWDGRKDGFGAILNYHRLDRAKLEKLIYTYLGDWIRDRRSDVTNEIPGAEGRLVAAQELQAKLRAILEGEPPYDIYVRWKPPHEQPIGWEPDLNDGVRLNIRPFVQAEILRVKKPSSIHWNKDRGKNLDGSDRLNDLHLTRAEKEAARRNPPPDAKAARPGVSLWQDEES
jgi:hypothetical protein